ncbi:hypothetical protein PHLGIDRAFT_86640 [Phlebiopsis gigantea 11061_1 CR5-6]|uniref:Replication protein A C-terminal domain-containing protein n=1 Tax=Phlebiopsis gigantea (strain 11061_1 CR5-6) TaxID=745531 RepID=A0A0C3SDB8_PHLG1|nr:hypothetical protein PHLGIDRAFT_86640 [Phlebiopsis gigantea 11061_1 CR5-6]
MSQFNDYYANKGEGGGGYVQSPFSSPGGGARRQAAQHALRPVSIKQLLSATQVHADAEFKIDDLEVGQITLVAHVVEVRNQTTNCTYTLDDGTGRYEARHWADTSDQKEEDVIRENTYVRVMGGLKSFSGKHYINATHVRPCKDSHEPYFHKLDTMTVSLILKHGLPGQPRAGNHAASGNPNGASAYTAQASTAGGVNDQWSGLPDLQQRILRFILAQPNRQDGIPVTAIARAIGGQAAEISEALDILLDEGHVYTTMDDTHFDLAL